MICTPQRKNTRSPPCLAAGQQETPQKVPLNRNTGIPPGRGTRPASTRGSSSDSSRQARTSRPGPGLAVTALSHHEALTEPQHRDAAAVGERQHGAVQLRRRHASPPQGPQLPATPAAAQRRKVPQSVTGAWLLAAGWGQVGHGWRVRGCVRVGAVRVGMGRPAAVCEVAWACPAVRRRVAGAGRCAGSNL